MRSPVTGSSPNSTPPTRAATCRWTRTAIGAGSAGPGGPEGRAQHLADSRLEGVPAHHAQAGPELSGHRRGAHVLHRGGRADHQGQVVAAEVVPCPAQVRLQPFRDRRIRPPRAGGIERRGRQDEAGEHRQARRPSHRQVRRLRPGQPGIDRPQVGQGQHQGFARGQCRGPLAGEGRPVRRRAGRLGSGRRRRGLATLLHTFTLRRATWGRQAVGPGRAGGADGP